MRNRTHRKISFLAQDILERCTQCGLCRDSCLFLMEFNIDTRRLAEQLLADENMFLDPLVLYSCNLCGICKDNCPAKIDLGDLFLHLREYRFEKIDELPLAHQWVCERQEWISKNAAFCSGYDSHEEAYEWVLFPGCTLCEYNPRIVLDVYDYLKEKQFSTAIMLDCCGAPFEALGDKKRGEANLRSIETQMKKLGSSHIITACPTCYRIFRRSFKHYTVSSLYEVMDNAGFEKQGKSGGHSFHLFHPCKTRRDTEVCQAVRNIIRKMGYHSSERENEYASGGCCGMGGMVGASNPVLAMIIGQQQTEGITDDIVTYCAACRDALANYLPSVHVLDLVFSPSWNRRKHRPPLEESRKKKNMRWLYSQLDKVHG